MADRPCWKPPTEPRVITAIAGKPEDGNQPIDRPCSSNCGIPFR